MECRKCKIDKNNSDFIKDKYRKRGFGTICKKCVAFEHRSEESKQNIYNLLESNNYKCQKCNKQISIDNMNLDFYHINKKVAICEKCEDNTVYNCSLVGVKSYLSFISHIKIKSRANAKSGLYKCECGKETIAVVNKVMKAIVKSCGCRKYDFCRQELGVGAFNTLYGKYRSDARIDGKQFTLSKDEFASLTKSNCHYCGDKPIKIFGSTSYRTVYGGYTYNGIDRINTSVGYHLENCVPCCEKCNRMKWILSQKEFIEHIGKIYCHCNKESSNNIG